VRSRVCESLVRGGSKAAIVDVSAARGVEVAGLHRRDIDALRQAAAGLGTFETGGTVEGGDC
jgi:hypothetical protein